MIPYDPEYEEAIERIGYYAREVMDSKNFTDGITQLSKEGFSNREILKAINDKYKMHLSKADDFVSKIKQTVDAKKKSPKIQKAIRRVRAVRCLKR